MNMDAGPLLALGVGAYLLLGTRSAPAPAEDGNVGGAASVRAITGATIGGLAGAIGGHSLLILANPVVAGSPVGLAATGAMAAGGAAAGAFVADKVPELPGVGWLTTWGRG